jgi:MFS family permease
MRRWSMATIEDDTWFQVESCVGKITFTLLPAALLTLLFLGQREWAAAMFCVLYGLSNGILTIVKGTTPRELFGREHYGAIAGAIAAPSLIALAAGPLVIAAVIEKTSSAHTLLGILFLVSLFSFGCFVAAVSRRSVTGKPAEHIQSAN